MERTTGKYDSNIRGFKPFYLTTFLLGMVWVGIHPVLVPTFVLSQTGSATDVALVLTLMSLGALAVPLVTGIADRYRAHREMQLLCMLLFGSSYFLIAWTQRPLLFALLALLTGIGVGGASVFSTVFVVAGGYSDDAQAGALALGSRLWRFESTDKYLTVLWLALAFLECQQARGQPHDNLAEVIRSHRRRHAHKLVEEACALTLRLGDIAPVLARFTVAA